MKKLKNPLRPGDVIRTHPRRGYWGCVVVLSARDSTEKLHPVSHFATTTFISKTKYTWEEIDISELRLLESAHVFRASPGEYYEMPVAPCIDMYTITTAADLDVIGHMDPKQIYPWRITYTVGDRENGRFPLSGPVTSSIGEEAVTAWLEAQDPERARRKMTRELREMERHHAAILEKDRQARTRRKSVK